MRALLLGERMLNAVGAAVGDGVTAVVAEQRVTERRDLDHESRPVDASLGGRESRERLGLLHRRPLEQR